MYKVLAFSQSNINLNYLYTDQDMNDALGALTGARYKDTTILEKTVSDGRDGRYVKAVTPAASLLDGTLSVFLQKSLLEIRSLSAELTATTPYIVYVPFENKSHWSTLELTFEEGCVSICKHDPLGNSGEFSNELWAAITQVLSSINFEGDIKSVHSKLEQRQFDQGALVSCGPIAVSDICALIQGEEPPAYPEGVSALRCEHSRLCPKIKDRQNKVEEDVLPLPNVDLMAVLPDVLNTLKSHDFDVFRCVIDLHDKPDAYIEQFFELHRQRLSDIYNVMIDPSMGGIRIGLLDIFKPVICQFYIEYQNAKAVFTSSAIYGHLIGVPEADWPGIIQGHDQTLYQCYQSYPLLFKDYFNSSVKRLFDVQTEIYDQLIGLPEADWPGIIQGYDQTLYKCYQSCPDLFKDCFDSRIPPESDSDIDGDTSLNTLIAEFDMKGLDLYLRDTPEESSNLIFDENELHQSVLLIAVIEDVEIPIFERLLDECLQFHQQHSIEGVPLQDVKELFEKAYNVGGEEKETLLRYIVSRGHNKYLESVLAYYKKGLNEVIKLDEGIESEETLLHLAVLNFNVEAVSLLIESGASTAITFRKERFTGDSIPAFLMARAKSASKEDALQMIHAFFMSVEVTENGDKKRPSPDTVGRDLKRSR